MKSLGIAGVALLICAVAYLAYQMNTLSRQVAELAKANTVQAMRETAARPAPGNISEQELKDEFQRFQLGIEEQLEMQNETLATVLADHLELQAEQQYEVMDEYLNSSAVEDRMFEMIYGYILDFMHPENIRSIEKQLAEQEEAFQEEEQRRYPEKAVTNNLRQIASAGQQYILEEGVASVNYSQLVGEYIYIEPVNGERYENIVINEDGGTIRVTTADGKVVEFTY
ncbi:MAG: hypothetical protein AAFX93_14545 [Verrucomicrobiota bacterium]